MAMSRNGRSRGRKQGKGALKAKAIARQARARKVKATRTAKSKKDREKKLAGKDKQKIARLVNRLDRAVRKPQPVRKAQATSPSEEPSPLSPIDQLPDNASGADPDTDSGLERDEEIDTIGEMHADELNEDDDDDPLT